MAFWIDPADDSAISSDPTPGAVVSGTQTYFFGGNALENIPATTITTDWLNMVGTEIVNAVIAAGLSPSKTNNNQLSAAVQQLGKKSPPQQYLYFSTNTSIAGGSTTLIGPGGISTSDSGARWMFPVAGTIVGVYLSTSVAPSGSQTCTGTVFINGTTSAAAATITGTGTSNSATPSVAVAANQGLSMHIVMSSTAATAFVSGYIVVQPT